VSRSRFWKLTADEVEKLSYIQDKVLNWEIKCVKEPEADAIFIGIFCYRHGTPFDYERINGIVFYHNNVKNEEISKITKFLKENYGGKELKKGDRVFLSDSKQIYSGKEISHLAKEMETKFNTNATISIEFQDISEQEMTDAGLPQAKLLPIAGK